MSCKGQKSNKVITSDTGCVSCAAAGLGSSGSDRRRRPRPGCSCRCCGRTAPTCPPTAAGRGTARPPRTLPACGGREQTPRQRPGTRTTGDASGLVPEFSRSAAVRQNLQLTGSPGGDRRQLPVAVFKLKVYFISSTNFYPFN